MDQHTNSLQADGARNDNKEVIIVTGSSGLIGSHIIKRLANNYRVVGLDREGNKNPLFLNLFTLGGMAAADGRPFGNRTAFTK